jgi:ferrochelatase
VSRTAVVLFNLGGPDSLAAVEPFLKNLFSDPAIISLPQPLRWLLAKLIARRRAPTAREIYKRLGNASPILANTKAQAEALEAALGPDHRVFIAMRCWHPFSDEAAARVREWQADEIVLLPLYPQFSITTTASSLEDWHRSAVRAGLKAPARAVCCYPNAPGFAAALAAGVAAALADWPRALPVRVLLSAHGLPKRIIERGDPYEWQVRETAAAVLKALGRPEIESVVCYQSRVGPLEWLQPATDQEIRRAGAEGRGVIVVPVAFVSEHSETLVELDMDYRDLAREAGVPRYERVPVAGTAPEFIAELARLVRQAPAAATPCPAEGVRRCPPGLTRCPCSLSQGQAA